MIAGGALVNRVRFMLGRVAFRRLARVAIVPLLLVSLAIGFWARGPGRQLERRIADLRALGQPTTLRELRPAPLSAEDDAAYWLAQAELGLQAIEEMNRRLRRSGDDWLWQWPVDSPRDHAHFDRMGPVLDEQRPGLELLERASRAAGYAPDFDLRESMKPTSAAFLQQDADLLGLHLLVSRTLGELAGYQLVRGRREEALDTCLRMLRLSRRFAESPNLNGVLNASALRGWATHLAKHIVTSGVVSAERLAALDEELSRYDRVALLRRSLAVERAYGLWAYDDARSGSLGGLGATFLNVDCLAYLDLYARLEAAVERPLVEFEPLYQEGTAALRGGFVRRKARSAVTLALPSVGAASRTVFRCDAEARCLRVLIALSRLGAGAGDVALDELGLPREATLDPYDGQPLKLRRTELGWLVYAVGPNGLDDGGNFEFEIAGSVSVPIDVGFGPER
jgi:hypothetical protein